MKTGVRLVASAVIGTWSYSACVLFLPAGTLNYWQAWVFIAVFTAATIVPSIYLARTNPAALRRRMRGGPLRGRPERSRRSSSSARFWSSSR